MLFCWFGCFYARMLTVEIWAKHHHPPSFISGEEPKVPGTLLVPIVVNVPELSLARRRRRLILVGRFWLRKTTRTKTMTMVMIKRMMTTSVEVGSHVVLCIVMTIDSFDSIFDVFMFGIHSWWDVRVVERQTLFETWFAILNLNYELYVCMCLDMYICTCALACKRLECFIFMLMLAFVSLLWCLFKVFLFSPDWCLHRTWKFCASNVKVP